MSIFIALLVLSILVFFHELGHYSAAKAVGVHVQVFSIGFGKKIFSFKWLNTEWKFAMIPLGGYVKMKGQEDLDPAARDNSQDSYNTKTPIQRIFILLAGPAANFVLAFFLYLAIGIGSPQVLSSVIGDVKADSPAYIAGLKADDRIVKIDDQLITTWKGMAEVIKNAKGSLNVMVERGNHLEALVLTPQLTETENIYKEKVQRKMIGIMAKGDSHKLELSFFDSIGYASEQTINASKLIFTGLQKLLSGAVPAKELGGVVSIVKVSADASEAGWMSLFFFAALISVNLGVLNLLPIPALDGGHIMFNLYELITKRIPSEATIIRLTIMGWVLLLGLMFLGLYNDINRLMG
ncbi:MAG: RIP metalloprotease RseP [Helicobacteraceae bacterium]|nr:RIP metalloprotease RseP [Helicobacteraceae bacterium]